MGLAVNGVDIDDSMIEAELAHHRQAANPLREAVHEVVLRQVLLQEADRLGIAGEVTDQRIEALFAREVTVPQADREACASIKESHSPPVPGGGLMRATYCLC